MLASLKTPESVVAITALRRLLEELSPTARVALCAHTRPDGDAIGSVAALASALSSAGFSSTLLLADNTAIPQSYQWMSQAPSFITPAQVDPSTTYDLFIALDTPDFARLGEAGRFCRTAKTSVLIDHHPQRSPYTELTIAATDAAATGQLIWELLPELDFSRSAEIATATYVALVSDTGQFAFSNTDEHALGDAAEMVKAGADPATIALQLFGSKPLEAIELDRLILSRIQLVNNGAVVTSWYSQKDLEELGVSSDWTENLIDLIRVAAGTQAAVLLVEGSHGGRVSLRSSGAFDVSDIAAQFGGGGHRAASGITWPDKNASHVEMLAALLPLLPGGNPNDKADVA
ncbi:MAG: DHH family phosphoesterase [Coriobacteriia bacterium]|nr:DHH family phosphoesterase [Coriobacteriia bacterium]